MVRARQEMRSATSSADPGALWSVMPPPEWRATPEAVRPVATADRPKRRHALIDPHTAGDEFAAAWRTLERAGGEPNCFMTQAVLAPALEHLDRDRDVRLFTLWDGAPLVSRLLGLMPVVRKSHYGRWPLPHLQNWSHDNQFLGTPLIAGGQEAAFWQAVLDWHDTAQGWGNFIHLVDIRLDGPVARGLAATGRRADRVEQEQRALLQGAASAEAYYAANVRAKKRKELRRLRNRLAEQGALETVHGPGPDGVDGWIQDFLALEALGWKGERGSALAAADHTRQFFADALRGAAEGGQADFIALRLDGRPIAMLVTLLAGHGGFAFKTAFDEAFARSSPGVLLQIDNLDLLQRHGLAWCDSCASEDHPMIDSLWADRRAIGRLSIEPRGAARRALFAALRLGEDRRAAMRGAPIPVRNWRP